MNLSIMIEILGSRFWKTSKRIRAVRKSEVKKGKRSLLSLNSSSDSDLDVTPNKRPKAVSMEMLLKCIACKEETLPNLDCLVVIH